MILANSIFLLGIVIFLAGEIMLLGAAYRRGFPWFLACLFLPVASWVFLAVHSRDAIYPVSISVVGLAMIVVPFIVPI
jgi:hypothetical protein